jgi:DNA-binding NtrC family response regulator
VDVRFIASTNRPVREAIADGKLREDLYYRLNVFAVEIPPLRDRREDIPALVEAFVADFNRRTGGRIAGVEPAELRRLVERDWPGNVRELRNAVEGACVLATGDVVTVEDLGEHGAPPPRGPRAARPRPPAAAAAPGAGTAGSVTIPVDCTLDEAERRLVLAALRHHGTRARTARALGIGLRTLYTKLAAWGAAEDAESA